MSALAGLVKPLVWVDLHKDGSCFVVCYDHPLGYSDSIARTLGGGWFFAGDLFATLEAAKSAAQADYEARIISALNLPAFTALSEDASKAADLARALQIVSAVLQSEVTRSGGQPFTGRWSIPSIDWRGTVPEALDLADAALDAKP